MAEPKGGEIQVAHASTGHALAAAEKGTDGQLRAPSGRAYIYLWDDNQEIDDPGEYEEVDPQWLLEVVLAKPDEHVSVFRQNVSAEFKRLRWARAATKHRISRKRTRFVVEDSFLIFEQDPPPGRRGRAAQRLVFLGEDPRRIPLEVIAVEVGEGNLLVIHAMELRLRYRKAYEEVRRWTK